MGMSSVIVESAYGKVEGQDLGGISVWKGIPYASPPIGDLRFRPPVPPVSWKGVLDTTEFRSIAPQVPNKIMKFLGYESGTSAEDCLYLNIWSPAADRKKRPVMVWIHGGAFAGGSGSSPLYDGASFAAEGDLVIVTINYRLGVFGFLHVGEHGGEEFKGSGNCGLLDQVAALQWVRENIEKFGGDPYQVTVFGESAGAMSIGVLLTLPSAKGLFQRAILQSGAAANVHQPEIAEKVAGRLLAALEIDSKNIAQLREIPEQQLLKAAALLPYMSLVPVVDGISLNQHPEQALAEGAAKGISILIGTNKDEYRLFSYFDSRWKSGDEKEITAIFERTFGLDWRGIFATMPEDTTLNQAIYDELMTMSVFTAPATTLAELQTKQRAPVWMYRFDWESPVLNGGLKACHALEVPFVWNTLEKPGVEKLTGEAIGREKLALDMHRTWIEFAKNGNPNNPALPEWPLYNLKKRPVLIFNEKHQLINDPSREERENWRRTFIGS